MLEGFMANGARESRARFFQGALLIAFGVFCIRLFSLQIADGEHYRIQSEKNTMQPVSIEASRGVVRDRNGTILVDNRPSYTISIIPPRLLRNTEPDIRDRVISRLGKATNLSESFIRKRLYSKKRHFYKPVRLRRDVSFRTVSVMEEDLYDLPGVTIHVESRRGYPELNGRFPLAAHLLGYVGLIDPDDYPRLALLGYSYDDQIGKRGIEQLCEPVMRGQDGIKYIEVNALGREVGSFPEKTGHPVPGKDIALTIDVRLQVAAERALHDSLSGSIVAMDPKSGEILALVSKPTFHPGTIRDPEAWASLQTDPRKPLLNRSLQGEYPPGSILKMIPAIAALEMGLLGPDEPRYEPCRGRLTYGDYVLRCHQDSGHGQLALRQALVQSCDVFFYHLGLEVGIVNWSRYARAFGLAQPTGIDIAAGGDGEAPGFVPTDRTYYENRFGMWVEGFMLNLAIGQGETLATPIQLARYAGGLAVGALQRPYLLKAGAGKHRPEPIPVSEKSLRQIRDILYDVVHHNLGTGRLARVEGAGVAGKTGTAQNAHGEDHAWFLTMAPVENPKIVIVVLVEHAGHGGKVAAPIAREILEVYLDSVGPDLDSEIAAAQARDSGAQKEVQQAARLRLLANTERSAERITVSR